ncbi:efflux RND transporter permease subunit, partial [Singulisphaera rosea]
GGDEKRLRVEVARWQTDTIGAGLGHPDVWPGVLIGDLKGLAAEMKRLCQREPGGVARYSYEELHRFADRIQDRLRQSPKVGKIEQIGVQDEEVYLYYSNRRLASQGFEPTSLAQALGFRNINLPGGTVELPRQNLVVKPSGKFLRESEIGDLVIDTRGGAPVYLRDLVEVVRGYEDPPRFLNFRTLKYDPAHPPTNLSSTTTTPTEPSGHADAKSKESKAPTGQAWTSRAITLAVRHIKGTQISEFSRDVDAALASLKGVLPDDLKIERTSNEPALVDHKIEQFKDCFFEAVVIVVVVSLLFMEWRSALLIAISIPVTVAMTLGFCALLGIDLQQISIAALIIALGLLVDDPVVAGDAINREIAHGVRRDV